MNTYHVKYPRTYHLPWSEGCTSDDKLMQSTDWFKGQRVIVTEKMDGENTTIKNDACHARSLDSRNHRSRNWVKGFAASFQHNIPDHMQVCGENLYATHSIHYEDLESYFLGFSFWCEGRCADWDMTLAWFETLGIVPVRVLYDGIYDEELIKTLWDGKTEGYVVRIADGFWHSEFEHAVGKFVRADHVQTDEHWMNQPIVPNGLKSK